MPKHSRRKFLQNTASAAAALSITRSARSLSFAIDKTSLQPPPKLTPFAYGDVQLLDGPMLEQFRHNHDLFFNLDDDSLLKPFRQMTGMPAPGEDMGGWYSPSSLFNPPKNMTGYVPGHSFGQYLSGLARAYAVTGNPATRQKVHNLVRAYALTVSPKFFDTYPLPAYIFDKITCGLIDAHEFAGDSVALSVLNHATDAALPSLPEKALTAAEMDARPHKNPLNTWDELYTLPENLYLAYQRGAGARYRELARRFLQDDTYLGPLSEGENILPGKHAYSHVNGLCSAMQSYLTDGSQMHLRAAQNGFRFVREQSFATGGWGPDESFRKPGTEELAATLQSSHRNFETPCGAYAHFKITRYLMQLSADSTFGDSMESVLYNTILGARPIRQDGVSFYYSDYNRDAAKSDYEQKWPCCSGTFPQLTADYGISSYFRGPKGVFVNLFVPSRLTWKQGGARVSLTQQTGYPNNGETQLHLKMDRSERFVVSLRIPAWAAQHTRITINGRPADIPVPPGSWAELDRTWNDGDRIELSLDMPLRLVPLDSQHPNIVALLSGPVALFAIAPADIKAGNNPDNKPPKQKWMAARKVGSFGEWMVQADQGSVLMKPFAAITNEHYRLYQDI